MSASIPPGEAAELAALRELARRLGVDDDVRLLSSWTPLPPIPPGGDDGLSGAADLLLRFSPVPVLGVTGSAGKSTTARLAEAMLRASGSEVLSAHDAPAENAWPTAELVARVLAARPPAWCVAELTSNHLAVCSASPHIACITNVWADHVDQHGSLAAYLAAKRRIVEFQTAGDWVVVNADDPGPSSWRRPRGAPLSGDARGPPDECGRRRRGGRLTARLAGEAYDLGPAPPCRPRPVRRTDCSPARARCSPAPRRARSPQRSPAGRAWRCGASSLGSGRRLAT